MSSLRRGSMCKLEHLTLLIGWASPWTVRIQDAFYPDFCSASVQDHQSYKSLYEKGLWSQKWTWTLVWGAICEKHLQGYMHVLTFSGRLTSCLPILRNSSTPESCFSSRWPFLQWLRNLWFCPYFRANKKSTQRYAVATMLNLELKLGGNFLG